ncbi:PilZ domain-containing protein [bacterium]|nr:PilZ domain-containing protein [bacterium]
MFQGLLSGFKSLFAAKNTFATKSLSRSADGSFRERRKLTRMRCSYEVKGTLGEKKFKATVVDIGVQGLKMRTGEKLKIGDKVRLAPPTEGVGNTAAPVEGKVLWIKTTDKTFSRHAGLIFTTENDDMGQSWVKLLLKELGLKPKNILTRRRFIRADCFLDAKYTAKQVGREVTGRVYNLGVGGMLLESNYELPEDEGIEIEFVPPEGLPILRVLAWPVSITKDGTVRLIGLEFRDQTARQVDLLRQYLKLLLKPSFNNERG